MSAEAKVSEPEVKEAFVKLAELGGALGVQSINQLPGCWECQIDSQWWISMNGHREAIKDSHGAEVPAFHACIEFNGWPAGIIGPSAGIIAAGSLANEDTFIAAIDARIAKERP